MVKNQSASVGDTRGSGSIPGWESSLEAEMATSSSILAWRIPWTEEPGGLQSLGSQRVNATEHTHTLSLQSKEREDRGSVFPRQKLLLIFLKSRSLQGQ